MFFACDNANFPAGETIPIRLFLGGFDLTPTFREVNKKYSTRYYLSLVLIDEGMLPLSAHLAFSHHRANASTDARRYFKQSEIVLFRQAPEGLTLAQEQNKLMAVS
jgi:vacuolar protein sorting-associated protein 26